MPLPRVSRCLFAVLVTAAALAVGGCDRPAETTACVPEPAAAAVALPTSAPRPDLPAAATPTPAPDAAAPPARSPSAASRPSASSAADLPAATSLRVRRLVLAEGVEGREPVRASRSFDGGEVDKVFAFLEVENPERLPGEVVVTFESPSGAAVGNVRLTVGASPRWRTWAFSRAIEQAGEWTAVVRDADGRVLAREPFSVTS